MTGWVVELLSSWINDCPLPCQGLATIYTDASLTTTMSNPLFSDSDGNYVFWAAPGAEFVVSVTAPLSPGYSFIVDIPADSSISGSVARKPASGDAVRFVSTAGNVSNDGLSWGTAKLTVQAAINVLPASTFTFEDNGTITLGSGGGTVNVGCGTFAGQVTLRDNISVKGQGRSCTILAATANGQSVVTNSFTGAEQGTYNESLRDLTISDASKTGVVCLDLNSVSYSYFEHADCIQTSMTPGIGLQLRAQGTNTDGSSNSARDKFIDVKVFGALQFATLSGNNAGTTDVTENDFISSSYRGPATKALEFKQWCDSNHFYDQYLATTSSSTTFIAFNTASPTMDVGVYSETFHDVTLDNFFVGANTQVGIQFNFTYNNVIRAITVGGAQANSPTASNANNIASTELVEWENYPSGNSLRISPYLIQGAWVTPPIEINLTAQGANIGATTLYSVPAWGAGLYRASCYVVVTQVPSTSGTLPACNITFTDADTSVSETFALSNLLMGSPPVLGATGNMGPGLPVQNVKASTTIQYSTSSYASVGATPLQYAIHIRLEYLGQ